MRDEPPPPPPYARGLKTVAGCRRDRLTGDSGRLERVQDVTVGSRSGFGFDLFFDFF